MDGTAVPGRHRAGARAVGTPKVAILSSAGGGGGGIAAARLAAALNDSGQALARVVSRPEVGEYLPREVAPMVNANRGTLSNTHFTLENPGYRRDWFVEYLAEFDVVNVHWASYLISLREIEALARRGVKVIFTLHDFHYITGGCHYPAGCEGYRDGCLACPQFDDRIGDPNVVAANYRLKAGILAHDNVHVIAPSLFLRDSAVAARLVPERRAHVLRNAYAAQVDPPPYPGDDPLRLVIVADSLGESRKGMELAIETLNRFAEDIRRVDPGRFVMTHVIGHAEPVLHAALDRIALANRRHGRIRDHARMVEIYAICDLLLTCSLEDNWPNVLVEAGSYGVMPVVGPGHGCEEFVRTYDFGQVAESYTPEAFSAALLAGLAERGAHDLRARGRARIRADHDPQRVAESFIEIVGRIV